TPLPAQTPPAVSSPEAFRTPASEHPATSLTGRRPKTLNMKTRSRDQGRTADIGFESGRCLSLMNQCLSRPDTQSADGVAIPHVGLNQPVDYESGRHMNAVLAGIFTVPLHLTVAIGDSPGCLCARYASFNGYDGQKSSLSQP